MDAAEVASVEGNIKAASVRVRSSRWGETGSGVCDGGDGTLRSQIASSLRSLELAR
jgi:hypothetical protein